MKILKKLLLMSLNRRALKALGRQQRQERGMTLIEIMVVLVIISLVGGFVATEIFGQLGEAQNKVAENQINAISDSLDLYKLQHRKYPSTAEGLQALTAPKGRAKPIMERIPKDPWENDYVYIYPGTHNSGKFDLASNGEDGVQGGGDDITNWQQAE
uniref:Type II secretion system core protein G n=1 Tax=uncultured marine bacterium MedDCM-OCT-S01-C143 TaxID=743046 RepID=D6PCC1_9BACT|nr:general secretion pathway protein G [uncultured marine bacterium MedDCM-OCT-S01-C143]